MNERIRRSSDVRGDRTSDAKRTFEEERHGKPPVSGDETVAGTGGSNDGKSAVDSEILLSITDVSELAQVTADVRDRLDRMVGVLAQADTEIRIRLHPDA
ncbi:hypothetical protein [Halocatena salina]|uniref:Uncharacterized protein n=1 Tax=Halocatena salina TaxID=2934340 RepID=A0A8U0AB61_9EURY|nr:hypothetical protein [Halocatena salina]UPM45133.1 hypothetical protein MW046_17395 [Halocatena salina]